MHPHLYEGIGVAEACKTEEEDQEWLGEKAEVWCSTFRCSASRRFDAGRCQVSQQQFFKLVLVDGIVRTHLDCLAAAASSGDSRQPSHLQYLAATSNNKPKLNVPATQS